MAANSKDVIEVKFGVLGGNDITSGSGRDIADTLNSIGQKIRPIGVKFGIDKDSLQTVKASMSEVKNGFDLSSVNSQLKTDLGHISMQLKSFSKEIESICKEIHEKLSGALTLGDSIQLNTRLDESQLSKMQSGFNSIANAVKNLQDALVGVKSAGEDAAKAIKNVDSASALSNIKTTTQRTKKTTGTTSNRAREQTADDAYESIMAMLQAPDNVSAAPKQQAAILSVDDAIIKLANSIGTLLISLGKIANVNWNDIMPSGVSKNAESTSKAVAETANQIGQLDHAAVQETNILPQIFASLSEAMQSMSSSMGGIYAKFKDVDFASLSGQSLDAQALADAFQNITANAATAGDETKAAAIDFEALNNVLQPLSESLLHLGESASLIVQSGGFIQSDDVENAKSLRDILVDIQNTIANDRIISNTDNSTHNTYYADLSEAESLLRDIRDIASSLRSQNIELFNEDQIQIISRVADALERVFALSDGEIDIAGQNHQTSSNTILIDDASVAEIGTSVANAIDMSVENIALKLTQVIDSALRQIAELEGVRNPNTDDAAQREHQAPVNQTIADLIQSVTDLSQNIISSISQIVEDQTAIGSFIADVDDDLSALANRISDSRVFLSKDEALLQAVQQIGAKVKSGSNNPSKQTRQPTKKQTDQKRLISEYKRLSARNYRLSALQNGWNIDDTTRRMLKEDKADVEADMADVYQQLQNLFRNKNGVLSRARWDRIDQLLRDIDSTNLAKAMDRTADLKISDARKSGYSNQLSTLLGLYGQIDISSLRTTLPGLTYSVDENDKAGFASFSDAIQKLQKIQNKLRSVKYDNAGQFVVNEDNIQLLRNASAAAEQYEAEIKRLNKTFNTDTKYSGILVQVEQYMDRIQRQLNANPEFKEKFDALVANLQQGSKGIYKSSSEATQAFNKLRQSAHDAGLEGETAFQKLSRILNDKLVYGLMATAASRLRSLIPQMYNQVVQLQDVMSQFAIVTDMSGGSLEQFAQSAFDAAQRTKTSVVDMVDAATVYSRLGFNPGEAMSYAEYTTKYAKVGNVDVSAAEDAITAMIKAYGLNADNLELALDKMVAVGNQAPISAAQIGEGFNNSAAALAAAGNSMDESIAILTAANTTLQDISKASTAVRTITARIRNSKADLEELGESTDDLATSTAKYRQDILSLSGVDIMLNDDTFKSTYDILDELAAKWSNLSDINRSSLTTLIAGTRQQAVFASLMQNWDEARHAVELCNAAGGEMASAYEKYTATISAHVAELKTQFAELSQSVIDSDMITQLVDLARDLLSVLAEVAAIVGKFGGIKPLLTLWIGGKITSSLPKIIKSIGQVKNNFSSLLTLIGSFGSVVKTLVSGNKAMVQTMTQSTIAINGLKAAFSAATIAATVAVALINRAKTKEAERRAGIETNAASANDLTQSLIDQYNQYTMLSKAVETDKSKKQDLLDVQRELLNSIGMESSAVDGLAGKYEDLSKKIADATKEELKAADVALVESLDEESKDVSRAAIQINKVFMGRKSEIGVTQAEMDAFARAGFTAQPDSDTFDLSAVLSGLKFADDGWFDILDIENVRSFYERLQSILSELQKAGQENGIVYERLVPIYQALRDELWQYDSVLQQHNKNLAEQAYLEAVQDLGVPGNIDELDIFQQAVADKLQSNDLFVGDGGIAQQIVQSLLMAQPELKALYDALYSYGSSAIGKMSYDLDSYIQKLSGLSGVFDAISAAETEFAKNGVLDFSTATKLIDELTQAGADWTEFLDLSNGKLQLNTASINRWKKSQIDASVDAARQQYLDAIDAYKQAVKNGVQNDIPEFKNIISNLRSAEKSYKTLSIFANAQKDALDAVASSTYWDKLATLNGNIGLFGTVKDELQSNGYVNFDTVDKIREAFNDVSGIDEYIDALLRAETYSGDVAAIFTQLTKAAIAQRFAISDLNAAHKAEIALALKSAGVSNSEAVAKSIVTNATKTMAVAEKYAAAASEEDAQAVLAEAAAIGITEKQLAAFALQKMLVNQTTINTSSDIAAILQLAETAGVGVNALYRLESAKAAVSKANVKQGDVKFAGSYNPYKSIVDSAVKSAQEDLKGAVLDFEMPDLQFANPTGGGGDAQSQVESIKSAFDDLNAVLEHYIAMQEQSFYNADRAMDYDGMRNALLMQVNYYKQIQENAHKAADQIRDYYRSQGMSAALIEQQSEIRELSNTWMSAAKSINDALDQIANAIREKLSKQIDDLQSSWQNLTSAAQEYADTGYISVDSLQAMADAGLEYMSLLKDENGQLSLNQEAISEVLKAKTEQLSVETALGYVQQVNNAISAQNTAELTRLLTATSAATNSTWDLVYAQAALLDLTSDQRSQLLTNINRFRAMAETTIASIGTQISDTVNQSSVDTKSALDNMLKYVEELIKYEHDQMKEALEDQLDDYQKLVDKQKELLEGTKDEEDYEREVSKRLEEIAKLQNKINLLSLDDSREANAQKLSLQQELSDLQMELSDYQRDYALSKNEEALDKEAEQYEEYTNDRIKQIEDEISSEQKLYELAIARIDSQYETLLDDVLAYNREAGNSVQSEIIESWNAACDAVRRYGSYTEAVANSQSPSMLGTSTISSGTYETDGTVAVMNGIVDRMKSNSLAWHSASEAEQDRLEAENKTLAAQIAEYLGAAVTIQNGVWYCNGKRLYDLFPMYHTGGVIGDATIKQNEEMAILQKGEMVATKAMQSKLFSMVDFVENLSQKLRSLSASNGFSSLLSNNVMSGLESLRNVPMSAGSTSIVFSPTIEVNISHNGDLDDNTLRDYGSQIADVTLGKFAEAFQKRGVNNIYGSLLRA